MASSRFSGVLQLTDLDDFIGPGAECIKPVPTADKTSRGTGAKIKIASDGAYVELKPDGKEEKLKKVEISLSDCLACSGCITSAESVLISQQSHEEMMRVIRENNERKASGETCKLIVLSLALQPVLSLGNKFALSQREMVGKLCGFFKRLGVDLILDVGLAHCFTLLELESEFIERFRTGQQGGPLFSSECPGWICYAEKSHGDFILPNISRVKSPQQVMGTLVKTYLADKLSVHPSNVYHVTLMPCYDKKLEASRGDFYNEQLACRDVDCVITAVEVEVLLVNENVNLHTEREDTLDWPWDAQESRKQEDMIVVEGGSSGGYAHQVFLQTMRHLFPHLETIPSVEFKPLRNPDMKEFTFTHGDTTLRFCIANGFRNIQNLIQKLKRKKCLYDFIEIMACPAGCLNGGAQIRNEGAGTNSRETVLELETTLNGLKKQEPFQNETVHQLYTKWLGGRDTDKAKALLYTNYHNIPKNNIALNVKW
ncbi:hypothetical protein WDU94_009974 [Cyamophila willieti]